MVVIAKDVNNIARYLFTDAQGHLQIDVLSAPSTAVTGTFWQATQPVSGTFWQATQPVSGTFWQETQPVSGPYISETLVKKTLDWAGAITGSTIWDPTAGKKFVIVNIIISCSAACTVTLFDNTDTTANRILKGYFAENGGLVSNFSQPIISSTADNILKITTSAAGGSVTVFGYEV